MTFPIFRTAGRAILALSTIGMVWTSVTPAEAQLSPGCTCPAGSSPTGLNMCIASAPPGSPAPSPSFPATCRSAINQSVGRVAASQQQISFSAVQTILEGRRDQLQGTLGGRAITSPITGYSASELDETYGALGYAGQSQRSSPLASPVYKARPMPANSGPSWASWVQGLGDWQRNDATSAADVGHFTSTYGAQAGVDGTWQNVTGQGDALVLGLVGSWTGSHVSYDGTPTTMRMNGPGVGVYSTYVRGGFSADLTTKFDFLQMTQDFAGSAPNSSVNLTNAGLSGNVQYKIDLGGHNFLEPTGGFSFTRTMFGSEATAMGLTDASTLRLQAGGRWGTSWDANGVSVEPTLKAVVYSNVIADGSAAATAAAAGIVPTDQGKVRGELDPNINLDFGNGYSASLSGMVRFGDAMLGGSANLNLRKQW